MRSRERGVTTVEFAIIAALLLVTVFGVIEIGRALFVWNTIAEATRRGARVAAVCPPYHPSIARVTIFDNPYSGTASPILKGLSTDNVQIDYLDPAGQPATAGNIAYVRVGISGYQHTLLIPFYVTTITVPPFSTTLPAESLGYIPEQNIAQCFGT